MKRWNGWGDDTVLYPLHDGPRHFLEDLVGRGTPPRDATFEQVITTVPASRLPAHRLVSDDAADRVRHARGHSLPDWIELRSGRIRAFPDGVAYPSDDVQVRELIRYAGDVGACLRRWDQRSGPHQRAAW